MEPISAFDDLDDYLSDDDVSGGADITDPGGEDEPPAP
jgi:hypothetical protein